MMKLIVQCLALMVCADATARADFRVDESPVVYQDLNPRSYLIEVLGAQYLKSLACQIQAGYGSSDLYYKILSLNIVDADNAVDAIATMAEADFAGSVQRPIVTKIHQSEYERSVAQTLLQFDTGSWGTTAECQALSSHILKTVRALDDTNEQFYSVQVETRFGGARLMAVLAEGGRKLLFFGLTYTE